MAWQNNLREISIILYRLKRNFGLPAVLKQVRTSIQDVTTGKITRTFTTHTINRAILLPVNSSHDFMQKIGFMLAGGVFDAKTRTLIIEAKDLPAGTVITLNDHLVINTRRYEIKTAVMAEYNVAWHLQVIELDSTDTE